MLSLGFTEMVLIAGIALVVMGPEKFPDFAKMAIKTFRDLRGYMDDVKGEVAKELNPLKSEMNKLSQYKPEEYIDSLTSDSDDENEEDPYSSDDDPYRDEYAYEYEDPNDTDPDEHLQAGQEGDTEEAVEDLETDTDAADTSETPDTDATDLSEESDTDDTDDKDDEFDVEVPDRQE